MKPFYLPRLFAERSVHFAMLLLTSHFMWTVVHECCSAHFAINCTELHKLSPDFAAARLVFGMAEKMFHSFMK